jgi:hypothetical protein
LRYFVVLAERAAEIAAVRAYRDDSAPREETFKRFLLDWVESERSDFPIVLIDDFSIVKSPTPAEAGLAFTGQIATMRAKRANHKCLTDSKR